MFKDSFFISVKGRLSGFKSKRNIKTPNSPGTKQALTPCPRKLERDLPGKGMGGWMDGWIVAE